QSPEVPPPRSWRDRARASPRRSQPAAPPQYGLQPPPLQSFPARTPLRANARRDRAPGGCPCPDATELGADRGCKHSLVEPPPQLNELLSPPKERAKGSSPARVAAARAVAFTHARALVDEHRAQFMRQAMYSPSISRSASLGFLATVPPS